MARKAKNGGSGLQGQALKDFRSKVAKLKSKGIVSKRVDARSQRATKYMQTKVRKFEDVLQGKSIAIKTPKDIRQKYTDVLEARGSFLIAPADHKKDTAKIKRGLIEIERPYFGPDAIKRGSEREVVLPFKLTDMQILVERLKDDPTLDGLKRGNELFAFRLDGWSSRETFMNAKEMGDYIELKYQHLFKPGVAKKSVKYLSFVRFNGSLGIRLPEGEHYEDGLPSRPGHLSSEERGRVIRAKRKNRERQALKRQNETQEDRQKRLESRRNYQKNYRRFGPKN